MHSNYFEQNIYFEKEKFHWNGKFANVYRDKVQLLRGGHKIWKKILHTLMLHYLVHTIKTILEFYQIFVAFSQYLNFNVIAPVSHLLNLWFICSIRWINWNQKLKLKTKFLLLLTIRLFYTLWIERTRKLFSPYSKCIKKLLNFHLHQRKIFWFLVFGFSLSNK